MHNTTWEAKEIDQLYLDFGEHLKDIIFDVRKNKSENQLSMKDTLPELIISCPDEFISLYKRTEMDIKACTGAQKIIIN